MQYRTVNKKIDEQLMRQIESLPERGSLPLKYTGEGSIKTFQNQIYAYLHRMGIKQFYKIYLEDNTFLRIKRLSTAGDYIITEQTAFNKIENFVFDNLLDINSLEEAKTAIDQAIEMDILLESDTIPALEEWQRVQGTTKATGTDTATILNKLF